MKLVKENWRLILLGVCACACTFLVNLARPYQNWIESYRCTLSISDGKVWVDASMIGSQSCDESSIHVFLEEKVNGEWVEVRLWSDVQEGVRAAVSESAPASPGGVYRVWMQVGATRNGRFQYKYVMSPEKTA
ncbi:MAG: hypothetical protein HFF34_00545 [Oscillospiraceae bacterium]|jgi:hypothetical protein|nr:hypothetical protein [Oscillospiraceae bacterium]MCI9393287.1 hypothetical protein [Oscillospiraceae bacterium]MCI9579847.1 hypothetical protein [Oscillospiraceae bacterium]